jgi:hypothetical protein
MLAIALSELQQLGAHRDLLASRLLARALALLAHRKRDLIARSARGALPSEHCPRHEQQRRVVVERLTGIAPNFRERFAHRRQHLARHLETEHVSRCQRIRRIERTVAQHVARDQCFYLSHRPSLRCRLPLGFGLGRRHARQLAQRRPARLPLLERARQHRKPLQRLGHPQLFLHQPPSVTEQPTHVFAKRAITEPRMHPLAPGDQQHHAQVE